MKNEYIKKLQEENKYLKQSLEFERTYSSYLQNKNKVLELENIKIHRILEVNKNVSKRC